MFDLILFTAVGALIGAMAVPLCPPLFRLAVKFRAWLAFDE